MFHELITNVNSQRSYIVRNRMLKTRTLMAVLKKNEIRRMKLRTERTKQTTKQMID